MSGEKPPPPLRDLDGRLRDAFARRSTRSARSGADFRQGSLALAFRIGVELVAALIVGTAIGWLLDTWLGTRPWLILVFFILGAAAGISNVFRIMRNYEHSAGYQGVERPGQKSERERGEVMRGSDGRERRP